MSTTVANGAARSHLTKLEGLRLSPAKANLTPRENRPHIGAALGRAIDRLGWDVKQAAIELGFIDAETGEVKHAQISRWIAGTEPMQLDRIYGSKLHGPFAIEFARDDDACVVETTVTYTVRRSA